MKSNQILMAGAIALSMILSGCSATSTSEDVKDAKTTETAKKADSKKSTKADSKISKKEDAKTSTKDKKESPKTETNKNTAEAVETKEAQIQKTRR